MSDADRCICCGNIIPEGAWTCKSCELKSQNKDKNKVCIICGDKTEDEDCLCEKCKGVSCE